VSVIGYIRMNFKLFFSKNLLHLLYVRFFQKASRLSAFGFQLSTFRNPHSPIAIQNSPHLLITVSPYLPFSPSDHLPIPVSPHLLFFLSPRLITSSFITKKGAWLEVNTGGSLLKIDAIAGCLLNSLSRNCLTDGLLHAFG
jgi:hypothetical protein